jgi:hypothetical protein
MVIYKCERCEKKFHHKSVYTKHLNTKYNCTIAGLNICDKCGKIYKHKQSLYTHKKTCDSIVGQNVTMQNNTQNIGQQNNVNVDNMKVVKFGSENLSYISDDIFKQIMGRGFGSIGEFIMHSHFRADHPENHNIYIANLKDKYIVFYDGDKWMVSKRDDMMEDIIYAKSDLLFNKFKELRHQMNQVDINRFMKYMNERDDDKTMDILKDDVRLQLYNNRKMPQQTRKHMEKCEYLAKTSDINDTVLLKNIVDTLSNFDRTKLQKIQDVLLNLT